MEVREQENKGERGGACEGREKKRKETRLGQELRGGKKKIWKKTESRVKHAMRL